MSLGDTKVGGDIAQEPDGYEFGCVECETCHGKDYKRQPFVKLISANHKTKIKTGCKVTIFKVYDGWGMGKKH